MNGGGSSTVVEPILSIFTAGTMGHFVSRTASRPLEITADPIVNSQSVPLVVLVGEDTASFGEIFSGVLQDTGRAKLAGQTTMGNVETLHGYSFIDGSVLWIAEERFDPLVSHADWEKTGIIPDVKAFADWDTFTFENDPSVTAAVDLLGHTMGKTIPGTRLDKGKTTITPTEKQFPPWRPIFPHGWPEL